MEEASVGSGSFSSYSSYSSYSDEQRHDGERDESWSNDKHFEKDVSGYAAASQKFPGRPEDQFDEVITTDSTLEMQ